MRPRARPAARPARVRSPALLSLIGNNIWAFYGGWLLAAFLGAGTSPLTWTRAVSLRFHRRRGLALGLTLLGTGASAILVPPLLIAAIGAFGWRGAYLAIALFIAGLVAPLVWVALRDSDDGRVVTIAASTGLTRGEALRTRQFWTLGIAIFAVSVAQGGTTVHLPALLADKGFAPQQVAWALSLLGFSVVIGRVGVGYLVDLVYPPAVAGVLFALPAVTLVLLAYDPGISQVYFGAILLGLAAGAEVDMLSFFVGRHFGLRAYGAIYSLALSFFATGAGLGPILIGWRYEADGGYGPVIGLGIAIYLGSAALIATMGRPRAV